ncbi:MAG: hypothetical protein NDI90_17125 [Nitrospira sp. BO4]|jgi:hypothetical protein|nr:hypothetical protein [Nitrospira sp. BO4]
MPQERSTHPGPTSKTLDEEIEGGVCETSRALQLLKSERYDGVLGALPLEIPGNFQKEFHAARTRLLGAGYTAKQIRDLMAQEMRRYRYAVRNPEKPVSYGGFLWPPAVEKDVSFLAHLKTAVRLGPEEGLAFLTDDTHAKKVNKGERYGKHQSRNAKHPRGKIEEADGQTIDEIIGRLALTRPHDRAKDLWDAFYGTLNVLLLDPEDDGLKMKYKTSSNKKSINFSTFEKTVSQYRTGKKNLPKPG